jgi:hypothetical protein
MQVSTSDSRRSTPNSPTGIAPESLQTGTHRDQHRPWLAIIAGMRNADQLVRGDREVTARWAIGGADADGPQPHAALSVRHVKRALLCMVWPCWSDHGAADTDGYRQLRHGAVTAGVWPVQKNV